MGKPESIVSQSQRWEESLGEKKKQAPLGSAMVEVMVPLKCMALIVGQGMKPW